MTADLAAAERTQTFPLLQNFAHLPPGRVRYKASLRGFGGLQKFLAREGASGESRLEIAHGGGTVSLKPPARGCPRGGTDAASHDARGGLRRRAGRFGCNGSDGAVETTDPVEPVVGDTVDTSGGERGGQGDTPPHQGGVREPRGGATRETQEEEQEGGRSGGDGGVAEAVGAPGDGSGADARASPPRDRVARLAISTSHGVPRPDGGSVAPGLSPTPPGGPERGDTGVRAGDGAGRGGHSRRAGSRGAAAGVSIPPAGSLSVASVRSVKLVCGDMFEEPW